MRAAPALFAAVLLTGCLGFGGEEAPRGAAPTQQAALAPAAPHQAETDAPSPAPTGADDPALRPTQDWALVTRRADDNGALIEFTPKGQGPESWTKMASATRAVLGEPASATKVRRYIFEPYRERCAEAAVEVLARKPPTSGDLAEEAVLICKGFDRSGLPAHIQAKPHAMLYLVVTATRNGYETFQFAWHHDTIPARAYRLSPLFDGEARAWRTGIQEALRRAMQATSPSG
ncbi:MAG: hypothetical protein RIB45_00945 [Marivibrio sp.]|uniref:hypothetical protein n=1 Tax=Marivibrio sp. TaxID=2039719 RepID=UPI0032ECD181